MRKFLKFGLLVVTMAVLGTLMVNSNQQSIPQVNASIAGLHGRSMVFWERHKHKVKVTRSTRVYKFRYTNPMANMYTVKSFVIKRGTVITVKYRGINFGWQVYGKKYTNNSKYGTGNSNMHNWFKLYKKPKVKHFKKITVTKRKKVVKAKKKPVKKIPSLSAPALKVAQSNKFNQTWQPAYLDQYSDEADLYLHLEDAKDDEDPDVTISNHLIALQARTISDDHYLQVQYNGKLYFIDNSDNDLRPYNTSSDGTDTIDSYLNPNSNEVVLKKGTNIKKDTEWFTWTNSSSYKIIGDFTNHGNYWKIMKN